MLNKALINQAERNLEIFKQNHSNLWSAAHTPFWIPINLQSNSRKIFFTMSLMKIRISKSNFKYLGAFLTHFQTLLKSNSFVEQNEFVSSGNSTVWKFQIFFCHLDFTWNQFWRIQKCKISHLCHFWGSEFC